MEPEKYRHVGHGKFGCIFNPSELSVLDSRSSFRPAPIRAGPPDGARAPPRRDMWTAGIAPGGCSLFTHRRVGGGACHG
jgi:hypothetical protein